MGLYVICYDDIDLEELGWDYNYAPFFVLRHVEESMDVEEKVERIRQDMLEEVVEGKAFEDTFGEVENRLVSEYGFERVSVDITNVTSTLVEIEEES